MSFKNILKGLRNTVQDKITSLHTGKEVNTLYELLYQATHDLDQAIAITATQTKDSFAHQWEHLKEGQYLLSDPWFKNNVSRILSEEEIQIDPKWFAGKNVLDVGCGNGRWSYGFAELGANITAVDVNEVAIEETRQALTPFDVQKSFYVSSIEDLSHVLPQKKYDLVFCWGVLHHCRQFNKGLDELVRMLTSNGLLYLYLYGRETVSYRDDLRLFKQRLYYNSLPTAELKYKFLLKHAKKDPSKVHNYHDIYAPLINRRFLFDDVESMLKLRGFEDITQTINHSEVFVRAIRSHANDYQPWQLPRYQPPYWFEHHDHKNT
ncbi:MAG: class I SAM-dependent methyltransferase [Phycisphaerales bacterium]|nr:class I SAM-dependent methyltransferase [Phycisphaerales bacterium]